MLHRLALSLGLSAATMAALATASHAQMGDISCDDSARLATTLKTVMGATRQGVGLRDPETMLEVWVADHNGAWLIVQNYANGTSCIVAMGDHWEGFAPGPA